MGVWAKVIREATEALINSYSTPSMRNLEKMKNSNTNEGDNSNGTTTSASTTTTTTTSSTIQGGGGVNSSHIGAPTESDLGSMMQGVYNPPELLELLKDPDNNHCADCGMKGKCYTMAVTLYV